MTLYYSDPGMPDKPSEETFDDLLARFSAIHLPTVSEGTRRRYQLDIDLRIREAFRFMPLTSIRRLDVESFRSKIMTDLSVKSVNMCMDLLRTIFLKAIEWDMLEKSPYRLQPLRQPKQKYQWWDKKEYIVRFLAEARTTRHYAAFKLALETGLRVGEIVGLSKQDVDLKRCQLHIHRQWLDHQNCYGTTKGRKERFINFDPASGLKEVLAETMLASGHPEVIFTTLSGNRVRSRKLAGRYFSTVLRKAAVPKIRFHDLRHTFASWYMIENDDIWSLMAILGHADVQKTQRYAHLSRKHQRVPMFSWNSTAKGCFVAAAPRNDGRGDDGTRENFSRSIHAPN